MHHLLAAFQELIIHSLIMQKLRQYNAYVQFDWVQQKLFKNNRKFVKLFQRPNSGAVGEINYYIRGSKSFDYKTSNAGR